MKQEQRVGRKVLKQKGHYCGKQFLTGLSAAACLPKLFGLFEAWKLAIGLSKDRVMWRSSFLGVMKGIQGALKASPLQQRF